MSDTDPFYRHDDELGIFGCLLSGDQQITHDILDAIRTDKFTHQLALDGIAVCRDLAANGTNIDLLTIGREWERIHGRRAPVSELSEVLNNVPSAINWPFYWEGVLEAAARRSLRFVGSELMASAANPQKRPLDAKAAAEQALLDEHTTENLVLTSKEAARRLIDDMQRRQELFRAGKMSGITYGFRRLDATTDGLQAGELVIVGARPSVGKTALGVSMLAQIAVQNDVPCCFISLETDDIGLNFRLLANLANVPLKPLKRGDLTEGQNRAVVGWVGKIAKAPIHHVNGTGGMDGLAVASMIRRMAKRHGVKVVFLDYLQKMNIDNESEKRTYGIAENLKQIVAATKGTGVATVALAQLNREAEGSDKRPSLRDLAECGTIERDADVILFLHRNRMVPVGPTEVIVAKARDGECGIVELNYNGNFTRFEDAGGPD